MKRILISSIPLLVAGVSHAAIVRISDYGMGEAGTYSGSGSTLTLLDSLGHGPSLTGQSLTPTVNTVGVTAPGSTAYLSKTSAGGWFDAAYGSNEYGLANTAADWAVSIWIKPGTAAGTLAFQTNSGSSGFATAARAGTLSAVEIGWAGGSNPTTASFDALKVWSFDSASDSLSSVVTAMTAVPEPATYGLSVAGALAAIACVRRRRRSLVR